MTKYKGIANFLKRHPKKIFFFVFFLVMIESLSMYSSHLKETRLLGHLEQEYFSYGLKVGECEKFLEQLSLKTKRDDLCPENHNKKLAYITMKEKFFIMPSSFIVRHRDRTKSKKMSDKSSIIMFHYYTKILDDDAMPLRTIEERDYDSIKIRISERFDIREFTNSVLDSRTGPNETDYSGMYYHGCYIKDRECLVKDEDIIVTKANDGKLEFIYHERNEMALALSGSIDGFEDYSDEIHYLDNGKVHYLHRGKIFYIYKSEYGDFYIRCAIKDATRRICSTYGDFGNGINFNMSFKEKMLFETDGRIITDVVEYLESKIVE